MRASYGAFSHPDILNLTWRQFETYLDSFRYLLREETEQGRRENKIDDLETLKADPTVRERKRTNLEAIKEKLKVHKERALRGTKQNMRKLVQ